MLKQKSLKSSIKLFGAIEGSLGVKSAIEVVAKTGVDKFKSFATTIPGAIGITTAAIMGIAAAWKFVDKEFNLTFKTALSNTKELVDGLDSTRSEIANLESEVDNYKSTLSDIADSYDIDITGADTISEIIDKIKDADGKTLSITDKNELSKIEAENRALERQIELKKKVLTTEELEAAKTAQTTLSRTSDSVAQETRIDVAGGSTYSYQDLGSSATITQAVKDNIAAIKEYEIAIENLENKQIGYEVGSKEWKLAEESIKDYKDAIDKLESDLSNKESELSTLLSALSVGGLGTEAISGFQDEFDAVLEALNSIVYVDLSETEKQLKSIEDYFDGSTTKNALKKQIEAAVKSGRNASDVMKELGISLDDAGLNAKSLNQYFDDMKTSAYELAEAVNEIDGSFASVEKAFEKSNSGATWGSMADYINQAKELYEGGKVGTDDFKSVVEWLSPENTFAQKEKYAFDSDAYVKAWKNAQNTINRYFDAENPLKSMTNFANDLANKGLAIKDGSSFTWAFASSAEAAKALGLSLEATEAIMKNLIDYGAEFDDVTWSGDNINRYKSALEGIKSTYDSMDSGDGKDRLGKLIDNWDSELAGYENDLDTLTEDKIVHIEFEYDIAQLDAEIQKLELSRSNEGSTVEGNRDILVAKQVRREESEKYLIEERGMVIPVSYALADGAIAALQTQLASTTDENVKLELQAEIENITDLQNQMLDAFDMSGLSWNEFIKTDDFIKFTDTIESEKEDLEKRLSELSNEEVTIEAKLDDRATPAIDELEKRELISKECVLIAKDEATNIINLWNQLSPEPKFAEMSAEDQATYVIDLWNSMTPEQKRAYLNGEMTITDNLTGKVLEANNTLDTVPEIVNPIIEVKSNAAGEVSNTNMYLNGIDGKKVHTYVYVHKKNVAEVNGTAHTSGTAYAVGKLNDKSWLKPSWQIPKGEVALTGETGQELVVDPENDTWYTIGDNGAEFNYIPPKAIVFNARQTKDLLSKGYTTSRGKARLSGTAFNNGWNFGASSGGSSSKSSSKSSSSSSSADEFKETLDEIEILLNEFERQISNLDKVAQGAYRKWSERNKALSDEMDKVAESIEIQQKAYDGYREKAASIGLSDEWVDKILNGAIAIEDITDEDLHDKIKEFQTWADKAKECSDAILDLKDELAELASQKFENAVTEYENLLSTIEHRIDMLEGSIDKVEAKGYIVSTKMYEELAKSQQDGITLLEKEYSTLKTELANAMDSGDIEIYSEEWYSLVGEIQDVESALMDMNTELAETKQSMRELEWETFDRMQDMLSDIQEEAEFLTEIMSNEKMYNDDASITSYGQATLGLHAVNYNAYMSQAKDYAKELQKINEELANDPNNIDLLDRRQELLESQREMIKNAEDEKEAILDLIKEGYDTLLDSMQELIQKRKDMFSDMSDMYDFEKNVSEINKEISSLEKQRRAYLGNDSEEAQANIQKIDEQLAEAREDLQETEYDRYIRDQEKLLDSIYDETEAFLNARLDEESALLQEIINSTNTNASEIKDTLESEATKVGITLSDEMQSIWGTDGTFTSVVSTYDGEFINQLTTTNNTLDKIRGYLAKMAGESDEIAKSDIGNIDSNANTLTTIKPKEEPVVNTTPSKTESTAKKEIKVGGKINAGSAKIYDYAGDKSGEKQYFSKDPIYKVLAEKDGYLQVRHHKSSSGVAGWFKKSDVKAYKNGGLIDRTGLFWGDGTPSDPEIVLNPSDSENFIELRDSLRELKEFQSSNYASNVDSIFGAVKATAGLPKFDRNSMQQAIVVEVGGIEMYGVNDVNEFGNNLVHHLKNNKTVTRIIQADTLGALFGKNSLDKHKY